MEVIKTTKIEQIKERAKSAAEFVKIPVVVIGSVCLAIVATAVVYTKIHQDETVWPGYEDAAALDADLEALKAMEAADVQE